MKEYDCFLNEMTFLGVRIYADPPTYFQGVKTPNHQDLCPSPVDLCVCVDSAMLVEANLRPFTVLPAVMSTLINNLYCLKPGELSSFQSVLVLASDVGCQKLCHTCIGHVCCDTTVWATGMASGL